VPGRVETPAREKAGAPRGSIATVFLIIGSLTTLCPHSMISRAYISIWKSPCLPPAIFLLEFRLDSRILHLGAFTRCRSGGRVPVA